MSEEDENISAASRKRLLGLKLAMRVIPVGAVVGAVTTAIVPAATAGAANITIAAQPVQARMTEAPAKTPEPPAVLAATADPPRLGFHGGRTLVAGRVRTSVATCQLKLLSKQPFPVVYAHGAKKCHINFYSYITVGPNPSLVHHTVKFEVIGRNAAGQFSRGVFDVRVAPEGSTYKAPPPPVVSTTPLPNTPPPKPPKASGAVPIRRGLSTNWSGYVAVGGPYRLVKGTLSVAGLVHSTPRLDVMSEWVGIDGWHGTVGQEDLIQAGVIESMVPCHGTTIFPDFGYDPGKFHICPWTLFIENGQASYGPVPQLTVKTGDSLTVEIWQQSGTDWAIYMKDDTSGQSWSAGHQYYGGPGGSAEWVVEDPGTPGQACGELKNGFLGQCQIASYKPDIKFRDLRITPRAVHTWDKIRLEHDGLRVSAPTPLRQNRYKVKGFDVSYTGSLHGLVATQAVP